MSRRTNEGSLCNVCNVCGVQAASAGTLLCLHTPVSSHASVFTRQCLHTPVSSHASVFTRQCLHTPVSSHASVFTRQCLHTPVSSHSGACFIPLSSSDPSLTLASLVQITKLTTFSGDDLFFSTTVTLKNKGSQQLTDVYYSRTGKCSAHALLVLPPPHLLPPPPCSNPPAPHSGPRPRATAWSGGELLSH